MKTQVILESSLNTGDGFTAPHFIRLSRNERGELVTHWCNAQDGGAYNGRYFGTHGHEDALGDYLARCERSGVEPFAAPVPPSREKIPFNFHPRTVEKIKAALEGRQRDCERKASDVTRAADYRLHWQNAALEWDLILSAIVDAEIDHNGRCNDEVNGVTTAADDLEAIDAVNRMHEEEGN